MPRETLWGWRARASTCLPAWHTPGFGTPVEISSGPTHLAGLYHSEQGNWGTVAAPWAVPQFFQFPIPAPQVAAWGDSGTDALWRDANPAPGRAPLLGPSHLSGQWWGGHRVRRSQQQFTWGPSAPQAVPSWRAAPPPQNAERGLGLLPAQAASGNPQLLTQQMRENGKLRALGFSLPSRPCGPHRSRGPPWPQLLPAR